ncbi:MAG: hypothetical protein FJZ11_00815 [Candidatus Omnitrophica bacterium]|nr:hypothetical protein [Candidatus Omnitrophota bacterium]
MSSFDIWKLLAVIIVILLIVFWRRRNAVWGGMTLGIIIGIIFAIIYVFKGSSFDWYVIGKGAILGTMSGFIAELLGKIADSIKRR